MNCEKAEELFQSYFDKILSEDLSREFIDHVNTCPHCSKEFKPFLQLVELIEKENPIEIPDRILNKITKRINEDQGVKPFYNFKDSFFFANTSLLFLLIFIFVGFGGNEIISQLRFLENMISISLNQFLVISLILFPILLFSNIKINQLIRKERLS